MQITTITPVHYPLSVRAGVNEFSAAYGELVQRITALGDGGVLHAPDWHCSAEEGDQTDQPGSTAYSDITRDDRDIRLGYWRGRSVDGFELTLHCFNSELAVVELVLEPTPDIDAHALKEWAEEQTKLAISQFANREFARIMATLREANIDNLQLREECSDLKCLWVGSILNLSSEEVQHKNTQALLHQWLDATIRPEDAEDIINGRLRHSLRWLNYVIVAQEHQTDRQKVEAMILAQYFYAVQHYINRDLLADISDVFLEKNLKTSELKLQRVRARTQLHITTYYEARNHLVRAKKQWVEEILQAWDFKDLLENAQRMVDVCSTRINEINNKKRSLASILTDSLLALIGLFAILDLALQFVTYSREMVTSPTLNYYDEQTSGLLSVLATWNIDLFMGVNLLIVVLLGALYAVLKLR